MRAAKRWSVVLVGSWVGVYLLISLSAGPGPGSAGPAERSAVNRYYPATHAQVAEMRHRMLLAGSPEFLPDSSEAAAVRWSLVGPRGMANSFFGLQFSGRIRSVATDTTDSSTIYAGTASGGAWVTRDGGRTWAATGGGFANPAVGAIAVNPADRSVWAGTGELGLAQPIPATSFSTQGSYLYRSQNFGKTWARVNSFPFFANGVVSRIAFDKRHPTDVYVATNRGLYKSTTGGNQFKRIRAGAISDVLIRSRADLSEVLSAEMGSTAPGVYRSTNGGTDFAPAALPGAVTAQLGRMQLAQGGRLPDVVYVSVATPGGAGYGIWQSNSFGAPGTWVRRSLPAGCCAGQGGYDQALAVRPIRSASVFLGWVDRTIWVSKDNARTWALSSSVHEDVHNFAFDPNDDRTMFHVSDGGIFKSTNAGMKWEDAGGQGITAAQVYYLTPDPEDPNSEWIGTQDTGVSVGHDSFGGFTNFGCCDGGEVAFAGGNMFMSLTGLGTAAAPNASTIQSSPRGAFTWSPFTTGVVPVWGFPPMPIKYNGTNLFTFSGSTVSQTTGTGLPWTSTGGPGLTVRAMAVDGSGVVYAGGTGSAIQVFSPASGWKAPTVPPPGPRNVLGFAPGASCSAAQVAYVALSGVTGPRIFRTADTGDTWGDVTGDLPDGVNVSTLLVDPDDDDTVYAATDFGVYNTVNRGANWSKVSAQLPAMPLVTALAWRPNLDRLLAGTFGRGVWEAAIKSQPTAALQGWYSPGFGDNSVTRDVHWRGCPGETRTPDYGWVRVEGRLYTLGGTAGTTPLYRWFSAERQDYLVSSAEAWRPGTVHLPDYVFLGTEGYVHRPEAAPPAGALGLYSWYSPGRDDNFTTTHPSWVGGPGDTRSPDYIFVRKEGYLLAPE